jgi:hypothetical protein
MVPMAPCVHFAAQANTSAPAQSHCAERPCSPSAPGNIPYSTFRGYKAVFRDNVQSYSTVEPAIDLTALSPMAFAWQQAGGRAGF